MYQNADITKTRVYSLSVEGASYPIREHFTLGEFACRDGSDIVLVHPMHADFTEELRVAIGMSLTMNSAYRTWGHHKGIYRRKNKTRKATGLSVLKITTQSAHLWAMAGDYVCADMKLLEAKMNELNPGGMGLYRTFIHGDVKGENRRWDNR